MSYEEAITQRITLQTALNELKAHGFNRSEFVTDQDDSLIERLTGELVSTVGRDGLYSGEQVLNWLGY